MQNIIQFILLEIIQNKNISMRAVKVYNKLSKIIIFQVFDNIAPIVLMKSTTIDVLALRIFVSTSYVFLYELNIFYTYFEWTKNKTKNTGNIIIDSLQTVRQSFLSINSLM